MVGVKVVVLRAHSMCGRLRGVTPWRQPARVGSFVGPASVVAVVVVVVCGTLPAPPPGGPLFIECFFWFKLKTHEREVD